MNRKLQRIVAAAGIATASLIGLTACGSGGGGSTPPAPPPTAAEEDATASASVAGLFAFAQAQIASSTTEDTEARRIEGINPPVDDSIEPSTL